MISDIQARLDGMFTAPIVGWRPITRGYTPALRGIATLSDGSTAFVKLATNALTDQWLRAEHRVYSALPDAPFRPAVRAWRPDPVPALALTDLSAARWPPAWRPGDVDAVMATLDTVHGLDLPGLPDISLELAGGWAAVADDPAPFLALGLVSPAWLSASLPELCAADASVSLAGDTVLHSDVRSDNLCLRRSGVCCLIDWNHTSRGAAWVDAAFWSASLRAEGGPPPESLLGQVPGQAAVVSGYFAARAGLPIIPQAPRVRAVQLQQLSSALPWVIRALSLPTADGPQAGRLVP